MSKPSTRTNKESDAILKLVAENSELRAEISRLKAGGCARDQRTTQFCAEAVELQKEIAKLHVERDFWRSVAEQKLPAGYEYGEFKPNMGAKP